MDIFTDISNAFGKVEWSFESHDPLWAWFIVGMYSVAALLCLRALFCSQRSLFPESIRKRCRLFWSVLFAVMLFLACNKQLDIQTYITAVAREVAHTQGWYDQRRAIQKEVIIVLGLLAFLFLSYLVYMVYSLPTSYKISMIGALCTFTFIGMRASSFHHLDHYVAQTIYGVKLHILVEIFGGLIVSLGALLSVRSIGKWEQYYDKHNFESEHTRILNTDFDLESDDDSSYEESPSLDSDLEQEVAYSSKDTEVLSFDEIWSDIESEVQPEEVDIELQTSKRSVVFSPSQRASHIADTEKSKPSSKVEDSDLYTIVSSKNLAPSKRQILDNATPRVNRESLMEINRKRRKLKEGAVLGGSADTGYRKDKKTPQHDNWINRADETGWI